jgi:hypothetical protein
MPVWKQLKTRPAVYAFPTVSGSLIRNERIWLTKTYGLFPDVAEERGGDERFPLIMCDGQPSIVPNRQQAADVRPLLWPPPARPLGHGQRRPGHVAAQTAPPTRMPLARIVGNTADREGHQRQQLPDHGLISQTDMCLILEQRSSPTSPDLKQYNRRPSVPSARLVGVQSHGGRRPLKGDLQCKQLTVRSARP